MIKTQKSKYCKYSDTERSVMEKSCYTSKDSHIKENLESNYLYRSRISMKKNIYTFWNTNGGNSVNEQSERGYT